MTFVHFFEFSLLGLGIFTPLLLWRRHRHFEVVLFFAATLLGLTIEILGVRLYRLYFYNLDFQLVLAGTPITIALGWGLLTYCMNHLASALHTRWWLVAAPAALIAVSLDLVLDPMLSNAVLAKFDIKGSDAAIIEQCVQVALSTTDSMRSTEHVIGIGAGLWIWCLPLDQLQANEHLFGVPSANFLSWYTIVGGFIFARHFFTRNVEEETLPRATQLMLGAKISAVSLLIIVPVLLAFRWLFYTFGVSGFAILGALCAVGLFALLASGVRRKRHGLDLLAVSLIFLNTVHCWVAYFWGEVQGDNLSLQIMLFLNLLVIALALWIGLMPTPTKSANNHD